MTPPIGPGAFVAIVGASGVGKDSVLGYARERAEEAVFVRRAITRPSGAGEDSHQLTEDEFARAHAAGDFAIAWRAHGLRYGLPISVDDVVRGGRMAVANVSRTVLTPLAERYADFRLVRVSVSGDVRRTRLAARGRESEADIVTRITRADPAPDLAADLEIVNDGTIAEAGELLLEFLRGLRSNYRSGG